MYIHQLMQYPLHCCCSGGAPIFCRKISQKNSDHNIGPLAETRISCPRTKSRVRPLSYVRSIVQVQYVESHNVLQIVDIRM
jgi:hypothetical protein